MHKDAGVLNLVLLRHAQWWWMLVDLDPGDLETLLESLNYAKLWISDSEEMPFEHLQEKLRRIEAADAKIRSAVEGNSDG